MGKRYEVIYEDIKKDITEGTYQPGEKLPSENDFCKKYNTSRGTIRRALDLLSEEGMVNSLHGKGVYVIDNPLISFSIGGLVSFKEASESMGDQFNTYVEKFNETVIDKYMNKRTNLSQNKEVYQIYRVRSLSGEKVILDINYFLKSIIPNLNEEIAKHSIYEYIEMELNEKIGFAQRVIQVEPVTEEDKLYLNMEKFNLVVVVKNFVHLNDGTLFEYTESRHRPDRFIFTDFARRR